MANQKNLRVANMPILFFCALISVSVPAGASPDTKTVEFNVKPGGVVYTFSERIRDHKCTFTYASQGGTNEQWLMSVGLSDDDRLFSCSLWRPQGKSYLFFTQFKVELKGAKIEYANAYKKVNVRTQSDVVVCDVERTSTRLLSPSKDGTDIHVSQMAAGGQSDVPLKPEEFIVGESTVTHNEGKFNAQLSKLTAIGRTQHDEL